MELHAKLNLENSELFEVSEQIEIYSNSIDEERQSINVLGASELLSESSKFDQMRNKVYSALKVCLKVDNNNIDKLLSEATERLLFLYEKKNNVAFWRSRAVSLQD